MKYLLKTLTPVLIAGLVFQSCEKKNIQFATDLGETFTNIIETDTVAIEMSTFFTDSFPTNSVTEFAVGVYRDSVLGVISAKPFLQFSLPEIRELESGAVYDSVCLVLKLNKNYYGDTTVPFHVTVNELNALITHSYSNYLFNTSSTPEKPATLANRQIRIYPSKGDSINIRLSDSKGLEMFDKFQQQSAEVLTADAFLNYFKGISINSTGAVASAVYSFSATADSAYIRLHYHTTTPYHVSLYKDLKFNPAMYFNQILSDRNGTVFSGTSRHVSSIASGNAAVTQPATGALLKMTFPSLRNLLKFDPTLKLLKATLVLQVKPESVHGYYPLPKQLYLSATDATNTIGNFLSDSTGNALLGSTFVQDEIYDNGTQYRFNLTSFINSLLTTAGSENTGLFLMQDSPGSITTMNRAVFNNSLVTGKNSKLIISLLTLNNK